MILSHRIALDPTVKQRRYFERAAGTARFCWNWALAEWNRQYETGEKPTGFKLNKEFNAIKKEQFPWISEISAYAQERPFTNLQVAFDTFFRKEGERPKFKKKGKCRDAFYIKNDESLRVVASSVRIPKVGFVRMRQGLRFAGRIMGATVSRTADRWFISIQVNLVNPIPTIEPKFASVGVDLGITTAATLSTGEKIAGPRPLKKMIRKLRLLSRRVSRKQKGSSNRTKATWRVAKLQARIANVRNDFLHKATTRIVRENQAVTIEDLNVRGMVKNRKLSRAIIDVGMFEFRHQLTYKSEMHGRELKTADRWFPSSKTCNRCGEVRASLELKERVFRCEACGHEDDRDVNAAKNLNDYREARGNSRFRTTSSAGGNHLVAAKNRGRRKNSAVTESHK